MKHCPICDSTEWDYDIGDGNFTYCQACFMLVNNELTMNYKKKESGYYKLSDLYRAIATMRDKYQIQLAENKRKIRFLGNFEIAEKPGSEVPVFVDRNGLLTT